MNTALLLIDIQNDYFPGGKMELQGSTGAGVMAAEILSLFRERRMPVIHIRHISARPGATFFLPGTAGSEIHACVKPLPGETVIEKNYPNSFRDTPLLAHLRTSGIDSLLIAGMMTHMCVDATTRAAFDHGFTCTLAHDACATKNLSFRDAPVPAEQVHAAFLAALDGVYARVMNTRDLLTNFR